MRRKAELVPDKVVQVFDFVVFANERSSQAELAPRMSRCNTFFERVCRRNLNFVENDQTPFVRANIFHHFSCLLGTTKRKLNENLSRVYELNRTGSQNFGPSCCSL